MKRCLLLLLLSVVVAACTQEDAAPPPEETESSRAALRQSMQLADCEVAYTIQAEVIHKRNEVEFRRYMSLAREAHVAATVALALDWNKAKKRPLKFYSELVDSWTEVDYQWWTNALENATQDGGGDILVLLEVYHSPTMSDCAGLQNLQSRLAGMAGQGDLK